MARPSRSRSRTEITLVGHEHENFEGARFPTNREVLSVFYYNMRTNGLPLRQSAAETLSKVQSVWKRTSIPIRENYNSIKAIEKLYADHRKLLKSHSRGATRINVTSNFDKTFDISTNDAAEHLEYAIKQEKNTANREMLEVDLFFLNDQLSERKAVIPSRDAPVIIQKEIAAERKAKRQAEMMDKHENDIAKRAKKSSTIQLASSESGADNLGSQGSYNSIPTGNTNPKRGRGQIMTKELADALDYARLSNDQAAKIICATAQALNVDMSDFNINRETIRREREKFRVNSANDLKLKLNPDPVLTVHWDGKTLPSLEDKNKSVSREAILVTGVTTNQLLGAPIIEPGKGKGRRVAEAVFNHIWEWDIADNVKALAFDTTAENTGYKGGAAACIEQLLGKDLLWLPCRHHIAELVLEGVYHTVMGPSTGPDIKLFKDFRKGWQSINQEQFSSLQDCDTAVPIPPETKERLISFADSQITLAQPRHDYLELLQLSLIFLGDTKRKVRFRKPGAMSSARWMAKAIYTLKMWLFRKQLKLDVKVVAGLLEVSLFVVLLYIPYWFSAYDVSSAPRTDLTFLQNLIDYKAVNEKISKAAVNKFIGHLWYLSELSVGLAVFDESLPDAERVAIVDAIQQRQGTYDPPRIRPINTIDAPNLQLSDLATRSTAAMFDILGIETEFFNVLVTCWDVMDDYIKGKSIVDKLGVTNDHAERGVKLMQDFNSCITTKEESYQSILVNAQNHRAEHPTRKKNTLLDKYSVK